jgi:hypothetical protein
MMALIPVWWDCPATPLRSYWAVPSAPGVGVGEALSAPASGNCETDGDSEPAGATAGVSQVFEVAGAASAGRGAGISRPGSEGPEARSGSVTPGGRCGLRMVPGDEAVAGFEGRIGRGIPGDSVFVVAPLFSSSAFLRALNWARRCSSSFSWASRSAANCRFTSCSIRACSSASLRCFWQEQNMARTTITSRAKRFFMSGLDFDWLCFLSGGN